MSIAIPRLFEFLLQLIFIFNKNIVEKYQTYYFPFHYNYRMFQLKLNVTNASIRLNCIANLQICSAHVRVLMVDFNTQS